MSAAAMFAWLGFSNAHSSTVPTPKESEELATLRREHAAAVDALRRLTLKAELESKMAERRERLVGWAAQIEAKKTEREARAKTRRRTFQTTQPFAWSMG